MPVQIIKGNIAEIKADAIVNVTDTELSLRRIHGPYGYELGELCRHLAPIGIGSFEITPSFGLPAREILHFAVPERVESAGRLRGFYDEIIRKAVEMGWNSVAVPLFPVSKQTSLSQRRIYEIAVDAMQNACSGSDLLVYLVVDDERQIPMDESLERRLKVFLSERLQKSEVQYCAAFFDDGTAPPFGCEDDDKESTEAPAEPTGFPRAKRQPYLDLEDIDRPILSASVEKKKKPGKQSEAPRPYKFRTACKEPAAPESFAGSTVFDPETDFVPEESFAEAVLRLVEEKGMTDPQCYSQANLSRAVFNKLKQSALTPGAPVYQPSKATALALTIGLRLTKNEAEELLKKAGYALSNSSRSDLIVEYFLMQGNYDIFELNEVLFHFGQQPLGSF